jgi:hypothetical protein
MNTKHEVEARLDRSLARQLRVPKLDRRFDVGVWARIEAAKGAQQVAAAGTSAAAARAARWLFASNVAGYLVAALLVVYFGARMLGGVDIEMPLPSFSPEHSAMTQQFISWGFTIGALAFGLMLTPLGRRLRSEFS